MMIAVCQQVIDKAYKSTMIVKKEKVLELEID